MEDMKKLWEEGMAMWDEFCKEPFTLKAMIFFTINDYRALFSLSGQFKGKVGWVVCLDETSQVYLTAFNKLVYMRHRNFLPRGHKYQLKRMDKYFDNRDESKSTTPSCTSTGKRVFLIVSEVTFVFGKKIKDGKKRKDAKASKGDTFKKMSIFFKYGMHVQKNVFDSIIGILLDVKGKTKEGLNSRLDLVNLGIRPELHPAPQANGKYHLLVASYNLNPDEKHAICVWLKTLKVSSRFCLKLGVLCQ
jgi:hypothetical protein